jgi:hypothetical protein
MGYCVEMVESVKLVESVKSVKSVQWAGLVGSLELILRVGG